MLSTAAVSVTVKSVSAMLRVEVCCLFCIANQVMIDKTIRIVIRIIVLFFDIRKISRKAAKVTKGAKKKINPEYSGASFANFVPSTQEETFTL